MTKFTRDYYLISKAAELLGCELDELLHKGACGILPIYVMPKEWWGFIFDQTYTKGRNTSYGRTPERTLLRELAEGRLWAGTVQFFEDGEEEVTVKSIWYPPNPETGKIRQVDLDIPVVFKKTQLYVFTKDIENLSFETTSQNEEGLNKKRPRLKSASATELTPPDLEDEITKIAKPIKPVETTSNSVETETRYLTIKVVMKLTGLGRQTIYDAIKAGRFPKQVYPTGSRAARWDQTSILNHMQSGSTNSRNTEAGGKAVRKIKGGHQD
jgi:predicted DNA-binding transcriptional regulator AlpA